jgi:hypothetical protein
MMTQILSSTEQFSGMMNNKFMGGENNNERQ